MSKDIPSFRDVRGILKPWLEHQGADMSDRNTFDAQSPEWQLCENMLGAERAAEAFDKDAARARENAEGQRRKASLFRAALEKLTKEQT